MKVLVDKNKFKFYKNGTRTLTIQCKTEESFDRIFDLLLSNAGQQNVFHYEQREKSEF